MNKYMQKRMRQWEKAEQHPLNQEALEILRVLYAISEDPENAHLKVPDELEDPPTMSYPDLPILDLLRWGESPYLLYDLESPSMNPMLYQLERMVMDGEEPNRLMKLISGPHGEGSIAVNLWTLLEGTPKQKEEIKSELRSNLKYLLEGARHVLNLRRQRRELLRAQQKKRENQVSVLTPEQEELLLDTIEVIIEDETVRLIAQDTLNESEQELLEALQVAGVSLESTQGTRITQETKTEPEPIEAPNISSAPEKTVHYSEDQIKDIVADYFKSLRMASPNYSVKREYLIQMGSSPRRADIAFLRNGKLVAIVECKRTGRVENGNEQLKSYLCATDTFLGIFANDGDPNKWTFWENHRQNNFLEIDRKTFENYIYNHDKVIQDREKKIKQEIEREIDAEIRERVRKNSDTNAIRQDETDRIRREVMENIDKTAIVNSVRSQIAQQAESGLLNTKVWTVSIHIRDCSIAFCVFSSHYSHKRNSEKNKRRCIYAQPRRGGMSIETLSPAQLSPVGAACLLSKNCPNFSIK